MYLIYLISQNADYTITLSQPSQNTQANASNSRGILLVDKGI